MMLEISERDGNRGEMAERVEDEIHDIFSRLADEEVSAGRAPELIRADIALTQAWHNYVDGLAEE